MAQFVRAFVSEQQEDWDTLLPMVELAVNSAEQASTGMSPFMMNRGREAALPIDVALRTAVTTAANPAAAELHQKMTAAWEVATKKLEAAKGRQKEATDKKRREDAFKVGELVLLSTEGIKVVGAKELQRSVKFAAKYIGPFPVTQVVNPTRIGCSCRRISQSTRW